MEWLNDIAVDSWSCGVMEWLSGIAVDSWSE